MRIPPPRVFWQKRLQAIENKGNDLQKERQESLRGGKTLRRKELAESRGSRTVACRANIANSTT